MKLSRNILAIDDETRWLRTIDMLLNRHIPEAKTYTCENSRQALNLINDFDIALVLLDLNMPALDGRQLLRDIREHAPYVRVIVLTGLDETDIAVECMKQGAYDFITKTSSTDQLLMCIRRAMEVIGLERRYHQIKDGFFNRMNLSVFNQILTTDIKMHDCFNFAATLHDSHEPILIEGEIGTGKHLFAESLQQLVCPELPLLELSLADMPVQMLEQKLFGIADQPGLLDMASTGFLLLDNLALAGHEIQRMLTQLCQRKRYFPQGALRESALKCRLLFSSTVSLEQLEQQAFSQGLLYCLQPQRIKLPPLRERSADIGLLLQHFNEIACQELGRDYLATPHDLARRLEAYAFPGNIAELKALTFTAVGISNGPELALAPFLTVLRQPKLQHQSERIIFPANLPTISETSQQLIHEALVRTNNNQSTAAKLLGITQSALSRRLSKQD
ncbi:MULTISPECIES: sigma-54-dependent transcriptional regulator [Shewanella]|uniref:sigma-54-dependent transcriptional regulator n=1 Tax=Shewanella TaxID=22 RepID=UPI000DF99317|nr:MULTISPECIES: response regulator [Shewanella]MCS6206638.1 sigma-54-dependent Fis family transcriptional regulator [Shewanella baltica]MCU8063033.1 response regulator [Shewanella sp. SM55]SUI72346.1 Nitrogen assimilation regulatory protein [Shewanella putrefaciens]